MIRIGDAFTVAYGDKRYENKENLDRSPKGTPLIASGARRNGVFGRFDIPATKKNIISVARTGSAGATFFHGYPCEVSSDALVLTAKVPTGVSEMLWYTHMVGMNRYRFNFGRKVTPGRVEELKIPAPGEVKGVSLPSFKDVAGGLANELSKVDLSGSTKEGQPERRKAVTIEDLFDVGRGNDYELCYLTTDPSGINFVSRTTQNNGVSARVVQTALQPFPHGCITVALGSQGGVLHSAVQFAPFYTGFHVAVLKPKQTMTLAEKMFCCMAIKSHRFRYSFGRQANRTLPKLTIPPIPAWVGTHDPGVAKERVAAEIRSLFALSLSDTKLPGQTSDGDEDLS